MGSNPHDLMFKAVLGQPEHAAGALRSVLPAAITDALDWPTLARCSGSFVDKRLRARYTDVLFSIAWRGAGEALVYVLYEHQSTPEPRMAFRLLRYLVRIWEGWLDDNPKAKRLPVVIPVVLYHGAKPWSAPVAFEALFELPDTLRAALGPYLVRFRYLLDDLSVVPDDQLRGRAATALTRLAGLCFKHARTHPDLLALLAGWVDVVREAVRAPNGQEALSCVMRYIYLVNEYIDRETLQAFFIEMIPEAKDTIMTVGERLIQQGIQQGVQQGVQQGIQEGIQRGQCQQLLRMLRKRFGDQITAETERRVASASADQLVIWADRFAAGQALRELFAD